MKARGKKPREVLKAKRPADNINWTIHRIRKSPAELVGYVQAPDAERALERYVAEHELTDWERRRLFAVRNGSSGWVPPAAKQESSTKPRSGG